MLLFSFEKVCTCPTRLGVRAFQSCQGVWHFCWVFRVVSCSFYCNVRHCHALAVHYTALHFNSLRCTKLTRLQYSALCYRAQHITALAQSVLFSFLIAATLHNWSPPAPACTWPHWPGCWRPQSQTYFTIVSNK